MRTLSPDSAIFCVVVTNRMSLINKLLSSSAPTYKTGKGKVSEETAAIKKLISNWNEITALATFWRVYSLFEFPLKHLILSLWGKALYFKRQKPIKCLNHLWHRSTFFFYLGIAYIVSNLSNFYINKFTLDQVLKLPLLL